MCLASNVASSWSLTQEVTGSSPFTVMTNIHWIQWKHLGKTQQPDGLNRSWNVTKSNPDSVSKVPTPTLTTIHWNKWRSTSMRSEETIANYQRPFTSSECEFKAISFFEIWCFEWAWDVEIFAWVRDTDTGVFTSRCIQWSWELTI